MSASDEKTLEFLCVDEASAREQDDLLARVAALERVVTIARWYRNATVSQTRGTEAVELGRQLDVELDDLDRTKGATGE